MSSLTVPRTPSPELPAAWWGLATRSDRLRDVRTLPRRDAVEVDWPEWTHPEVRSAYEGAGMQHLWSHQRDAADLAYGGEHVVVATGTASGKSLAYHLPALSTILRERRGTRRGATALYIAPTKALAADQLSGVQSLGTGVRAVTHDGDSPPELRMWTRDHAEFVLTNPDMLHHSLLPAHERWAMFWRSLRYVVLDECHHYRGMFGAHVAQVVRRLRRVAAHHGASPTFVLASATMATPERTARLLTGLEVRAVTADGSPRGQRTVGVWQPPLQEGPPADSEDSADSADSADELVGEAGAPVRRAASSETADLLADLVAGQVRSLAFIRSRRGSEYVARRTRELLSEVDSSLPERVGSYRGGYLPEERREIERRLREGDLLGLAATNALELGIDVSGLDAVLVAGFPGTRAAFWQQVGRAGRDGQEALGLLIARDDPLDTYLAAHPEALFDAPVEATVFDPDNPYVLAPHLCASAAEVPLSSDELALFGDGAEAVLAQLEAARLLRRRARGWFWTGSGRPSDLADLRSGGAATVQLVEQETGRVIGTVDGARAHGEVHEGAVYLHLGETWIVNSLDLEEHVAVLRRADPPYSTSAREITQIGIVEEREHTEWGPHRLSLGTVEVSHQVVSYLVRREPRRGGRGGEAARPARADPADDGGVVDRSAVGVGRGGTDGDRVARRGSRCRALLDRAAPLVRHLRPLGHRRRLDRAAPRHR